MKVKILLILFSIVLPFSKSMADDTDLSSINNVIYIESTTVNIGEQKVLSICMKNTIPIRGFQFDLYLPDGVTAVKSDNGRYVCTLNKGRLGPDDEHNLTVQDSPKHDGSIRFLCGSQQIDDTFTGNDGEIATILVNISDDMEPGIYPIVLKNMKLTETDISKYFEYERIETTLTVIVGDGRIHFSETDTSLPTYTAGEKGDITMARTINAGEWSTIVLPFNLTKTNATKAFGEDAQFAKFSGFEVDYGDDEDNVIPLAITVKFSSYTIPARGNLAGGTPVLIKTGKNISEIKLDDVTLARTSTNVETTDENGTPGKFIGTFVKTTVPKDGLFLSGNKFWYSVGKTNIKAFRGWFELGAVLNQETDFGANIGFVVDDEPASVDGIPSILTYSKNEVYTLQGQYIGRNINLKRLPRGIYIVDGKKMVIK